MSSQSTKRRQTPAIIAVQSICFELTPALIAFRRTAGDANRHLNTMLVALETLKSTTPIRPPGLVVPWTKPGVQKEWDDSRDFALKGAMIAVVDGLDQYMRVLSRIPGLCPAELGDVLSGRAVKAGRRLTVAERFEMLGAQYPKIVLPEYIAGLHLLGYWRNWFVHHDYRFGLALSVRKILKAAAPFFAKQFGNADMVAALDRFTKDMPPTLDDLSTLIAVAQRAVRAIDEHLLQLQTGVGYAMALMRYLIATSESPKAFVESTWMYGGNRSAGRIHALFLDNGGNHDDERRFSAPTITRTELNNLFAFGINRARVVFGIAR
jgi:hypothetical protein